MSPVGPLEPSQTGFLMTKRPQMASKTASKLCLRPIPESAWKNGNFDPHKFIPQYSFDWSSLPDMKYTLTAHLPKAISGRNGKTRLRSQLKSISGTPMSNLSRFPAKNITVQALFIFGVPKWGSSPPRGAFWTKFHFFWFQLMIYVQRSHHANLGLFGKLFMPPGHLLSFLAKSVSRGGFGVSQEWGSWPKNFFSKSWFIWSVQDPYRVWRGLVIFTRWNWLALKKSMS